MCAIKSTSFRHLRWTEALLKLALVNQYTLQMGHQSSTLTKTVCISLERVNRFICTSTLGYEKEITTLLAVGVWVLLKFDAKNRRKMTCICMRCQFSKWGLSLRRRLEEAPVSKWCIPMWQEFSLISSLSQVKTSFCTNGADKPRLCQYLTNTHILKRRYHGGMPQTWCKCKSISGMRA